MKKIADLKEIEKILKCEEEVHIHNCRKSVPWNKGYSDYNFHCSKYTIGSVNKICECPYSDPKDVEDWEKGMKWAQERKKREYKFLTKKFKFSWKCLYK